MAGASYDRYNAYVALPQIETNVTDVKSEVEDVKSAVKEITSSCPFPVGSVLLFNDTTDPNTTWAGTVWTSIGADCYLVGSSSNRSVTSTGGSNTKNITTDNLPSHYHGLNNHKHDIDHGHTFNASGMTVSGGASSGAITGGSHSHKIRAEVSAATGTAKYHVGSDASYSSKFIDSSTHTHDLPSHSHTVSGGSVVDYSGKSGASSDSTAATGGGTALNIEPSYYTVAIWARTE